MIKGTRIIKHKTKCTDNTMSPKSLIENSTVLELMDTVIEESRQLEANNFSLNMRRNTRI